MPTPDSLASVAARVEAVFDKHAVKLTMGGEPTYVPLDPQGPEWCITALGPTKLRYACGLADALIAQTLPGASPSFSPGKFYPGEINPRWVLNLIWNRDGSPLTPAFGAAANVVTPADDATFRRATEAIIREFVPGARWLRGIDPIDPARSIGVLPLDHDPSRPTSRSSKRSGRGCARWSLPACFRAASPSASPRSSPSATASIRR